MPVDLPPDPPAASAPQEAETFDLATIRHKDSSLDLHIRKRRCPVATGGEIVVCAPDPEENRVRPLPDTYKVEEGLPPARISLGDGASLDVHVESAVMPGGTVSNRVMVGLKLGF
ncbi:hypothetical protein [Novosphingobium beihaiensis]|uniref:Uncharacterized protein n=1 Tax=Novosphingobium beihaiensis TaxID=2930389 RepID=A0ABT0BRR7_9SPHN|nr:hypothetical protein [Novosphingobium beihaiensis]MCJ2187753.1 hypothetical protein [Novosphingobium beihaiensis]